MKYHIDTIPVWDAFKEGSECPLCILNSKAEQSYIESFLGGSVMEPDTRIQVNKKGFCAHHFDLLYKAQNRLGLALMTHTYLKETMEEMTSIAGDLEKLADDIVNNKASYLYIKNIIKKNDPVNQKLEKLSTWSDNKCKSCIICDRLSNTMERYYYTVLHLWQNDKKFKEALINSKGFCLYHFTHMVKMAEKELDRKKQAQWAKDIIPLQLNSFERIEKELYWFTQKFDFRNQNKPWGNSKDAPQRALQKLTGNIYETGNQYEE